MSVDAVSMMTPMFSSPADSRAELARKDPHQAALEFERLLVGQLLDQIPIPGLEGTQAGTFLSMVHDAMAHQIVDSGGLGLADEIERALVRRGGAPDPAPAPLPARRSPASAITSGFGYRTDPIDHTRKFHDGLDLAAPAGTAIHVLRPGVVTFAGRAGGYGNLVVVDHGGGLETRYGHCASLSVAPGDRVEVGDVVGTVGSTGRSTGPHLHYEVRRDGIPVDPETPVSDPKGPPNPIRGEDQNAPTPEESP